MIKNLSLLLVVLVGSVILAACSHSSVNNSKYFTVAVSGSTPPYSFYDKKTNQLVGFDIDIANEIAKRLGKELKVKTFSFNQIIWSVMSNQVDCGMESMYLSPQRTSVVDFTIPYNVDDTRLAVHSSLKNVKTVDDLKKIDVKIAMRNGTVYPKILADLGFKDSQITIYPSQEDLHLAILNGKTNVIASGNKRLDYIVKTNNLDYRYIEPPIVSNVTSGITVNKKNKKFLAKLNSILKAMIKDGTYHKIAMRWFGYDPLEKAELAKSL